MTNYPAKVYLNGNILDHKEATISVFDRGFLFGDSIYEVMVRINGSFLFEQAHLDRLSYCVQEIDIDFDVSSLVQKTDALLEQSDLIDKDCLLYIQVTRGVAPRKHQCPKNISPTLMMYAIPYELPDVNEDHYFVVTVQDNRWYRCDIKTTSLLGNIMANTYAADQGAYESVFIRDEKVTEASHCNVFFVKDSVVYTHPANTLILNGITRQVVVQLCKDLNLKLVEESIKAEDIHSMDEAFLTGTTTQIASIRQIDDYTFYNDETVGPITKRLQDAYLELKSSHLSV